MSDLPDIFEYWADLPGDATRHPSDQTVLERVPHHFQLDCLVGPYRGRLRTARAVLLFLSPGFEASDRAMATTDVGKACYVQMRTGDADLPEKHEHPSAYGWASTVLKQFSLSYEECRSSVAFLNIGAYKSTTFEDWRMLFALPSSRFTLDWAQTVLFPSAERGERAVVCLRSAALWGLRPGSSYGSLHAPHCTRGGFMLKGPDREAVIASVKRALDRG